MLTTFKECEIAVQELNDAARKEFERWLASRQAPKADDAPKSKLHVDDAIRKALSLYFYLNPLERQGISTSIDRYGRKSLLGFGAREAARGVREGSPQIVRDGLLAIAVEGGMEEPRESMIVMAMLYHSFTKLGSDADHIFRDVAEHGSKEANSLITEFANRDPKYRCLSIFNISEKDDASDGFKYESSPTLGWR